MVGNPLQHPDLRYVSAFKSADPIVFVRAGGRDYVVVSSMEANRARTEMMGASILTPEELGLRPAQRRRVGWWALGLARKLGLRRVVAPAWFPLGIARLLERGNVSLRVARGGLFPERRRKNAREFAALCRAQRAAVAGMRAVRALLAASRVDEKERLVLDGRLLTAERARAALRKSAAAYDVLFGEPIVACGAPSADPHQVGSGPLRAGESIVVDIFPQEVSSGYWGDLTRTLVKGRPRPEIRRMHAAVTAAQQAALAEVRAGARTDRIHAAARRCLERAGFKNGAANGRPFGFIHGTGHGVGLEIHEPPSLGTQRDRLMEGDVITVEPGLYYPDVGGVRVEDTVQVTAGGWRLLARCPNWFVVP